MPITLKDLSDISMSQVPDRPCLPAGKYKATIGKVVFNDEVAKSGQEYISWWGALSEITPVDDIDMDDAVESWKAGATADEFLETAVLRAQGVIFNEAGAKIVHNSLMRVNENVDPDDLVQAGKDVEGSVVQFNVTTKIAQDGRAYNPGVERFYAAG